MKRFQHTVSMSEGVDEDLRLLLIGKTGSGKSSTGNIIFNDRVFKSVMSSSSVTRSCQTHTDDVNNRRVTVTDTPDFIFSTHTDFDSDSELKKALELCSPGAHVILLTLSLSTFTEQEMDFIGWFEQKFGADALRFTVVLFTHAGQRHMRTLAEMIRMNPQLSAFINRCRGGFCEMNIKAPTNRGQVTELMQKIDILVSENSNSCYTLDMMKETERRREEERERREEEEKRERIREEERREREHQMELDRVRRETENSVRRCIEQEKQKREEEEKRREKERRERERQIELDRVKIEREIRAKRELELKLKQEKAKIVENKKKAEKQLKYVNVLMFFAVMSGGVLVLNRDSSHGWMFTKGFIAGGSVRVLTGILCRLMSKSQFICSSFHERPSAVRQIFLETAGVACGGIFAGAFLHHFKGENQLHIPVLPGAAGAFTGILTSFLSSFFCKNV